MAIAKSDSMHWISMEKISLLVLLLLMLAWAPTASAHVDDIWPYVTISCDKTRQSLIVSEGIAESETEIPKTANVRGLDGMLKFIQIGESDGILEIKSPLKKTCKLGKSTYQLVVQPYNYNRRVQGMCGGAAPTTQLAISRNRKILIRDLVFRINCHADGDTDTEIEGVSFSEFDQKAEFQIRQKKLRAQKNVIYKMLPSLHREDLFQ